MIEYVPDAQTTVGVIGEPSTRIVMVSPSTQLPVNSGVESFVMSSESDCPESLVELISGAAKVAGGVVS